MQFMNVVRRILKLQNCERVGRKTYRKLRGHKYLRTTKNVDQLTLKLDRGEIFSQVLRLLRRAPKIPC